MIGVCSASCVDIRLGSIWSASAPKLTLKVWQSAIFRRMSFRNYGPCQRISGEKLFIAVGLVRKLISRAGEKAFPTGWTGLKLVWLRVTLRFSWELPTTPTPPGTGLFNICRLRLVMLGREQWQ